MHVAFRSTRTPVLLALAIGGLSPLTGCSNSASSGAGPTAAKSMLVIQYGETDGAETDSILTFSTATTTSTANPSSTLSLPSGFDTYSLATSPSGEIFVGGYVELSGLGQILVYPAGSTGAATPSVTLTGGTAGTFTYPDYLAVNSTGQLFVFSDDKTIEAFPTNATSAAAPTQYLTWGKTNFQDVYGFATDTAGEIFVVDYDTSLLYAFAAGATGATAPARTISGTDTGSFAYIWTLASDPHGNLAIVNYNDTPAPTIRNGHTGPLNRARHIASLSRPVVRAHNDVTYLPMSIVILPAGADGTPTPLRTIAGSSTNIVEPYGLAMDAVDNLYYVDWTNTDPTIAMFSLTATGNVAPTLSITSTAFTSTNYDAIATF